jgi:hypothetical protein
MTGPVCETRRMKALACCRERLCAFADAAAGGALALTCVPPLGFEKFPFGDLAPLGLLLHALRYSGRCDDELAAPSRRACAQIEDVLQRGRQAGLWSYHSGGQITAIDSALVLLGVEDELAVARLEEFRDPHGGYVPQLWTTSSEPGKMPLHEEVRHWCQPDRTIACLVRFLRRRHNLPQTVSLAEIADKFDERSGLFIANPWLVDWFYALSLAEDANAGALQDRLAGEILAGASEDGTFGCYDPVGSTAAAVLALTALRVPHSAYSRAFSFLESSMLSPAPLPAMCPFYSTRAEAWDHVSFWELLDQYAEDKRKQLIRIHDRPYTITLYDDLTGCLTASLVALALLAVAGAPADGPAASPTKADAHARYRAATPSDYIQRFAMPPYVKAAEK